MEVVSIANLPVIEVPDMSPSEARPVLSKKKKE